MENSKVYLYPKWLRIWHAFNALGIIILIITGLSMQYSNVEYASIPFDIAVSLHNLAGVMVALSYLSFIVGNLVTPNGGQYKMKVKGLFDRLLLQSKYYFIGYFKHEPRPFEITKENKFNPLQRVSYVVAMYFLVPLVIISGIALLYPGMVIDRFLQIGGIQLTAIIHASLGFLISLFLVIHLYVASVGKNPLGNYRGIITGYHEE